MDKETQSKIQQLQLLEQNTQSVLMQKQQLQAQEIEVDNALAELAEAKGETFKIIGPIMVASSKDSLKASLEEKKQVVLIKLKNLEKQESQLKDKASKLQAEVMEKIEAK